LLGVGVCVVGVRGGLLGVGICVGVRGESKIRVGVRMD